MRVFYILAIRILGKEKPPTAAKSLQSCPTLCDPTDCSLPGFSVHGILQATTLEWVAISFSKKNPRCNQKDPRCKQVYAGGSQGVIFERTLDQNHLC